MPWLKHYPKAQEKCPALMEGQTADKKSLVFQNLLSHITVCYTTTSIASALMCPLIALPEEFKLLIRAIIQGWAMQTDLNCLHRGVLLPWWPEYAEPVRKVALFIATHQP